MARRIFKSHFVAWLLSPVLKLNTSKINYIHLEKVSFNDEIIDFNSL
jgi:hypothetical protein